MGLISKLFFKYSIAHELFQFNQLISNPWRVFEETAKVDKEVKKGLFKEAWKKFLIELEADLFSRDVLQADVTDI